MHNVLLSFDQSLFIPSLTLINSIIKNNEEIHFYILLDNNKKEYEVLLLKYFPKNIFHIKECKDEKEIKFIRENIVKFEKNNHIFNVMNYGRFLIPYYFQEIDKGIYVDIDMIVQQNFDKIIEEYDYKNKDFEVISPLQMNCNEMGLDKLGYFGKAFNAGFMVWNIKRFREENKLEEVKNWMKRQKEEKMWKLGTQPILNIIYYNKVIDINKKWNSKGFGCIKEDKRKEKKGEKDFIIHWTGKVKPWENSNVLGFKYWEKYKLNI